MSPTPLLVDVAERIATVVGAAVYRVATLFCFPGAEEPTIALESSTKRSESSITELRQPLINQWYEGDIHGSCKHEKGISFDSLDQSSSTERLENLIIERRPPPSTGRYHGDTDGSYNLEKEESGVTERLEKSIKEWKPPSTDHGSYKLGKEESDITESLERLLTAGSYKEEQKIFAIPDHQSSTKRLDRTIIKWKRPNEGWHKVNTDCSCKHKDKISGVGGLIRDHSGEWKLGFVARIIWKEGKATDRAELWGIYYGLKVAWEEGFRRIIVESDNKTVVEKVQMIMSAPNCDDDLLMKVKKIRQRKWKTKVVFIHREGNACADFMAKLAVTKTIGLQILKEPPRDCHRRIRRLLSKDL